MFDRQFFGDTFPERVREFAAQQSVRSVKVNVVTRDGQPHNIQAIHSGEDGVRLVTVDGAMVFLPYHEISRVEVSAPEGEKGPLGFQVPASP